MSLAVARLSRLACFAATFWQTFGLSLAASAGTITVLPRYSCTAESILRAD